MNPAMSSMMGAPSFSPTTSSSGSAAGSGLFRDIACPLSLTCLSAKASVVKIFLHVLH